MIEGNNPDTKLTNNRPEQLFADSELIFNLFFNYLIKNIPTNFFWAQHYIFMIKNTIGS